jgi:peptidoglycan/xylan/chitin deacetylase (PgdA/CDA1 family)
LKQTVKRLVGQGLFSSRLDAILLRSTALVVSFHRVHDNADASDGLTVSRKTFERYCRFFQRRFRVVSLPELVRKLESGRTPNRELVITFDDGYRDNFENAMPVLEKLSLPASFFVITQWIGTDIVPFWDQQRGTRYPWMTWDEVRSLHRKGFDIGAHTRTHVDLGKVSAAVAQEEIVGSRLDLERELAAPVESFAYPYGRRDNITHAAREIVKAAEFRCCCSGFGGELSRGTGPFHLLRTPISPWYEYPHQFGFDAALGRTEEPASKR